MAEDLKGLWGAFMVLGVWGLRGLGVLGQLRVLGLRGF